THLGENDVLGDFCLTLIESLDTLAILKDKVLFAKAIQDTIKYVPNFDLDSYVQVFETNIRILGGLLSAHIIATDHNDVLGMNLVNPSSEILDSNGNPWVYKGELLGLARELGWRLLPAFENSPSGIPYPRVNLRYGASYKTTPETCTAGAGTLILEFATLSRLTNETVFEDVAKLAIEQLWFSRSRLDLIGNTINLLTENWEESTSGISAGIDSFYEYLFKGGTYLNDPDLLEIFDVAYQALLYHSRSTYGGYVFANVNMYSSLLSSWWVDSLSAYFPGLMAQLGDVKGAERSYMIYYHLWRRYRAMPERFSLDVKNTQISFYPLRPEFAESTYFLYLATKDPFYLEVGEMIINDINSCMRAKCGFGALRDMFKREIDDRMESFLLSETFKYLYLLFDEDNPLNKGDRNSVFTTEAHYFPPLSSPKDSPYQYPANASFKSKQFLNFESPPKSISKNSMHFPRIKAKLEAPRPERFSQSESDAVRNSHIIGTVNTTTSYGEYKKIKSKTLLDICPKSILSTYSNQGGFFRILYEKNIVDQFEELNPSTSLHSLMNVPSSVDYAPTLPLRQDFEFVGLLVWPFDLTKKGYVLDTNQIVLGGTIPDSETNALQIGIEWNLKCSATDVLDVPPLYVKTSFEKQKGYSNKEDSWPGTKQLDIIRTQSDVAKDRDHLTLSFLHYLTSPYMKKPYLQGYSETTHHMYMQRVRKDVDLLPFPVYKELRSLGAITEEMDEFSDDSETNNFFSKSDSPILLLSNGHRTVYSDLVHIKTSVEVAVDIRDIKGGRLKESSVQHKNDYKAKDSKQKNRAAFVNYRIYKLSLGRVASFSHKSYVEKYSEFRSPNQIVVVGLVVGSGSSNFGCERFTPLEGYAISGKILLIKRGGGCTFEDKARNAERAGAIAVFISMSNPAVDFSKYANETNHDGISGKEKFELDNKEYTEKALEDLWKYGGLTEKASPSTNTNADTNTKKHDTIFQFDDIQETVFPSIPVFAVFQEYYNYVEKEISKGNIVRAVLC
ncbi:hypothetical protein BB560_004467, partial [Smittium megazygosporum]